MQEPRPQSDFYVYIYFRPEGTPCYVGKGRGNRWDRHLTDSHNKRLSNLIKKHGEIPRVKVRTGLTNEQAIETEIAFIKAIGRGKEGPLFNLTDGGEGMAGHKFSKESRIKMGIGKINKKQSPEHLAKLSKVRKGRTASAETKLKLSVALKDRPKTPEHNAAVSAAKKGKSQGPLSEDHKKAIGDGNRGQTRSPEAKAAIKLGQNNMTPEAKALKGVRISSALTGKKLSPSHCASISRVQIGRVRPQEIKDKISATMKALRAAQREAKEKAALETEPA